MLGEGGGKGLELDSEEKVTFKNGHTPQEGTKEHMNVVEVSTFVVLCCGPYHTSIVMSASPR